MDSSNSKSTSTESLNLSRAELHEALSEQIVDITFIKKDGSTRVMKCTLRGDMIVPYEKKTDRVRESKENIMPVWDVEADAWRSFDIESVKEVTYNGIS